MPAPAPQIGQLLGRYRILEEVGAGGMGVVYRAHDQQLERDVAIKVLPAGTLSDDAARLRFRKEALALAKVNHPNIATVHDFNTDNGLDFLVTEFIPGDTLDARTSRGALNEAEVVSIGVQLAHGLEAAHDQSVLHRDLKPGNLRLMPSGRLKILDFGLAKLLPSTDETVRTASLTESQQLTGTLPYMPPEQLRGRSVDARSDIWSAGVVLYELATGHRPFEQKIATALADDIIHKAPTPPRALNSALSPGLARVILKCMQKDPLQRYTSAAALRADLERLSVGKAPVTAARRSTQLLTAVVVLVMAVAAVFWIVTHRHAERAAAPRIRARRSVAVLGFKDLSGKPDQAWLSTALSEMLTSELAAGESLRTISGEDVARLKIDMGLPVTDTLAQDTLAKIHKALGTDLIVLGSYLNVGGQLRLDLRLQDAVAGETVATVSETGSDAQLLQLVSRTGDELRQRVGVAPISSSQAAELKTTQPSSPDTVRLYAQGLTNLRNFDALSARDLLQKAVKLDGAFALGHSALAEAWSQLGYDQNARDEAKRAFDLSQGLSREDRLVIEGRYLVMTKNWPKAVEIYQTLYTFFPDNLEYGLRLADAQISGGKSKDALVTLDGLRKLPPPAGDDPRIDLEEAHAHDELADYLQEQAAAQRAQAKARQAGMFLLAARARSREGGALYQLGRPKEAMAVYQGALQTYQRLGDRGQLAHTYYQISMAVEDQGDYAGARKIAEQSLALYQQIGNPNGEALALNEIAITLRHMGDYPAAIKALDKSYALKKEVGDMGGMIAARGNLANILDQLGDISGAQEKYQEVLELSRQLGNKRFESVTIGNLANLHGKRGEIPQALEDFQRAIQLSKQIGNKFSTLWHLTALTGVQINSGDLAAAEATAKEAVATARSTSENSALASALQVLGDVAWERGDLTSARQSYQQALDGYHKDSDKNAEAELNVSLADLSREQGNLAEAEQFARQSVTELDKEKDQSASLAHASLADVLLAQGKLREAQAEAAIAVKTSSTTQNLTVSIPAQISFARVQGQAGSATAAIQTLQKLSADCKKHHFVAFDFEARFALGEIQMRSDPKAGRATLQSLVRDAQAKAFGLISSKATAALESANQHP